MLKIAIAAIGILLGIVAVGTLSDFVGADSGPVNGSGELTVGGRTYTFATTTCFVSENDFVAAGPGLDGSDEFWVSASSVNLDLAFGTDNEVEQPADDQLWLVSGEGVDWVADDQAVVAEAPMTDRRDPDSGSFIGTFRVQCGTDA